MPPMADNKKAASLSKLTLALLFGFYVRGVVYEVAHTTKSFSSVVTTTFQSKAIFSAGDADANFRADGAIGATANSGAKLQQRPMCLNLEAFLFRADVSPPLSSSLVALNWWDRIGGDIANISSAYPKAFSRKPYYHEWISRTLMPFYTSTRMRRSAAKPFDPKAIRRIFDVIESGEQVQILILGGSITFGMAACSDLDGSIFNNSVEGQLCAWSGHFEHLLNAVLDRMFGATGKKRVRVWNLSSPGTSWDSAAITLKFAKEIIGKNANGKSSGSMSIVEENAFATSPHLVFLAYAANDWIDEYHGAQRFKAIRAALNVRPCDDVLPIVSLVNDLYEHNGWSHQIFHRTGQQYQHAEWHRLPLVDYGAIVRGAVLQNNNDTTKMNKLMGSKVYIHNGIGMHIGIAWAILFNLMQAALETCAVCDLSPSSEMMIASTLKRSRQAFDESIPKHVDQVLPEDSPSSLYKKYQSNIEAEKDKCQNFTSPQPSCAHAWVTSSWSGVRWPGDVTAVLSPYLTHVEGWEAAGHMVQQPRTGWYARKKGATFTMTLKNVTTAVRILTIFRILDYLDYAKIQVNIRVISGHTGNTISNQRIFIDAYLDWQGRIVQPASFELSKSGARMGDTIELTVTVVNGTAFCVRGLMLCQD